MGARLLHELDGGADEHVVQSAQRRVGAPGHAVRQLDRRQRRARLLHLERAEEGRPAAEDACRPWGSQLPPRRVPGAGRKRGPLRGRRRSSRSSRTRCPAKGVWRPTGRSFEGGPPVLVTTFRPELDYPQIVAYVAWFDHTRTEIGYYPGRYEPPNAAVRGPMMVPYSQRWRLLATFNGGFTYEDGRQRLGRQRPHQRAAEGRQSDARRLPRRSRRDRQVERRPERRAGRRVGPPEPRADRLERASEPRIGRRPEQPGMGVHARRRHPRLAHRRRHRPSRQPDLRRGRRPDRDHASPRSSSTSARCGRWSSTSTPTGTR